MYIAVHYRTAVFVVLILTIVAYMKFDAGKSADQNAITQCDSYALLNNIDGETTTTNLRYKDTIPSLKKTTLPLTNVSQVSKCTYEKDVTIYMDAFLHLAGNFFGCDYLDYFLKSRECKRLPGGGHCIFNYDNKHSDAILYYGTNNELPYIRVFDDQIVIVFTLEAESGIDCHVPTPDKYDIKVSYKRDSTVPLPYFCHFNEARRIVEMGQPDLPSGNRKLVAGFIKNCGSKWRIDYIKELMKYVHVDQWGKCLRNTHGDFYKSRQNGDFRDSKIDFLKENPYKFLLSFENIPNDGDYVTEKVYHGYMSRTIPIYYGDKAVFELVPGNSTFIYANDYTPKELAELIKRIDSNDTLYSQYFTNWDLSKMRKLDEQYCSEYFMCKICRKVWEKLHNRKCTK